MIETKLTVVLIPIIASFLVTAALYYIGLMETMSHRIQMLGACISAIFAWITYMNSFLSWQVIGFFVLVFNTITSIIVVFFDYKCSENIKNIER